MDQPHPKVVRVEREHNYAQPWYKKLNAPQKYPSRVTRFLYLKNFPRHFLSKYPHAFSANSDGTIDVGKPSGLSEFVKRVKEEPMDLDQVIDVENLVEQDNKTNTLAAISDSDGGDNNCRTVAVKDGGNDNDNNDDDDGLGGAGDGSNNDHGPGEEEVILDTSTWTQQMDRLYFRTFQIFQEHHLTKLVHENLPNGPIKMVNLMENTSLQLRHSFGSIAGWDNELLIWLNNLFTTKLPMHEHLITTYHEVMQYLSKRLPRSIEKFYSTNNNNAEDRLPSSIATTPLTSAATTPVHPSSGGGGNGLPGSGQRSRHSSISHHNQHNQSNTLSLEEDPAAKFVLDGNRATMPRRLPSNPLILLVPSGPTIPSQPMTARMEYWKTLLSSMGQLVNVNIPYKPEQTAQEVLQVIKTNVRDKIRDTMRKKFNELRPLLLVGFNQGSLIAIHCALENPGLVSAIICLGFPLTAINGFRGDLDDPMLDMSIPMLFVVGQMASAATLSSLERLRESMSRSDTGLVVVGGANDKLVVNFRKKLYDGITQYHVDKSIADEIYDFVSSINMQPPDGFV